MGKFVAGQQAMTAIESDIQKLTKNLRKVCHVVRIELVENEFKILISHLSPRRHRQHAWACEEIMRSQDSQKVLRGRTWTIEEKVVDTMPKHAKWRRVPLTAG